MAVSAQAARTGDVKPGDIPKRAFGKTGEQLTIIGQAGGRFPMISFEEAKAVTMRAYELGINYFDTRPHLLEWPFGRSLRRGAPALPQKHIPDEQVSRARPQRRRSRPG